MSVLLIIASAMKTLRYAAKIAQTMLTKADFTSNEEIPATSVLRHLNGPATILSARTKGFEKWKEI